ncbi:MAG: Bug family tripartite tricarboxylate transporter substrate binding protein [Atribacterota bacterium]
MKKSVLLFVLIVTLLFVASSIAFAEWPEKPITVIIPWPPAGDPSTIVCNAMAPLLSDELGVPVKIINKGGGAATVATDELAKSKPDGYTVGLISIGPMITQPLRGVTPYKTEDLRTLGLTWASPFTLAARGDAPYDNLQELAEYAKENELKLGHYGLGAVPTLIAMNIAEKGGFEWIETSFSNIDALLLTRGDVDVVTCSTPALMDYIETGEVKILTVMSPTHYDCCPDVQTVSEQGFGNDYMIWFGLFVPKDVPNEIAQKFEKAWFKVMDDPKVKESLKNTGVVVIKMPADKAKEQIARELEVFGETMKKMGMIE